MTQNEPGLAVSEIEEDERNARQDAEDDNNKPLASNQSNKSMMDSQSLQSKIAGLPAATGAETAGQETVPPEEEPDLNDTPDASAVPIAQEKKVPEKMDKTVKKAETIKPEHEATKDVAKPSSDTAKKAGGKLSRWSLQAGSFSKKENAQAMVDKLRKQGFPASIVAKGNLYRIKIGPELDKAKAAQMKSKLAAQKIQSYLQAE